MSELPPWISVPLEHQNGSITGPRVPLPFTVFSAPLRDSSEPYETTLSVLVKTAEEKVLRVPVSVLVTAQPVASECSVDAGAQAPLAFVGAPAVFTLTSRDINGRALNHVSEGFVAEALRDGQIVTGAATIEYAGDGNFTVSVTAPLHGDYVVRVSLQGVAVGNVSVTVACAAGEVATSDGACVCGAGHEPGTATSTSRCVPCAAGFYKVVDGDAYCVGCEGEHQSTAADGAASPGACVCVEDYYFDAPASVCDACVPGTTCDGLGTNLTTLVVDAGYWRLSAASNDVQRCAGSSACAGGLGGGDDLCAPGHAGPLCEVCLAQRHYFDADTQRCVACPSASSSRLTQVLVPFGVVVICALVLVFVLTHLAGRDRLPPRVAHYWAGAVASVLYLFNLMRHMHVLSYFKIFVSFSSLPSSSSPDPVSLLCVRGRCDLVVFVAGVILPSGRRDPCGVFEIRTRNLLIARPACRSGRLTIRISPQVYDAHLPEAYTRLVPNWLNADIFELTVPSSCVGAFEQRLLLRALVPLLALLTLAAGSVAYSAARGQPPEAALSIDLPYGSALIVAADVASATRAPPRRARLVAATREGLIRTLPLLLFLTYLLLPSIANGVFRSFNCKGYEEVTEPRSYRYFLAADPSVECDSSSEYAQIQLIAAVFVAVWAGGVPAIFGALLLRCHRSIAKHQPTPLSRALTFLHQDYHPTFCFWELGELLRKLVLTGFVLLIPPTHSFARIVTALLLCYVHGIILLVAQPFRSRRIALAALVASISLFCTFLAALLCKLFAELEADGIEPSRYLGVDSALPFTVSLILLDLLVLAGAAAMTLSAMRKLGRLPRVRTRATGEPPELTLDAGQRFHTFISHTWANAQDQAATIKRLLLLLLPWTTWTTFATWSGMSPALPPSSCSSAAATSRRAIVRPLAAVPPHLSHHHFTARHLRWAGLREVAAAVQHGRPLILVHEPEENKGGVDVALLRSECPDEWRANVFGVAPRHHVVIPWYRNGDLQRVSIGWSNCSSSCWCTPPRTGTRSPRAPTSLRVIAKRSRRGLLRAAPKGARRRGSLPARPPRRAFPPRRWGGPVHDAVHGSYFTSREPSPSSCPNSPRPSGC